DSIRNVATYLGNVRGRHNAIVYFSEGIDYDINNMFSDQITEAQTVMDTTLGLGMSSIFNEVRLSQDSLRVMGDETGGFAVVNQNNFRDAFQRIVDDNSSYYVMGYYSTNDRRDGRFRKIEVKLANKPGLTVRARKVYVPP